MNRDPNFLILSNLDDKSLVAMCQTNKLFSNICNSQEFWEERIQIKFPQLVQKLSMKGLEKYKGDRTWSEYYIRDLRVITTRNAQQYLYIVSENGRLDQVILTVLSGADIHADGDRSVRWAARNGYLEVVKYLVSQGADIRAYDDYALMGAAENGYLDVVKYLVSQGAYILGRGEEAMRIAAKNGHSDVVKYLISVINSERKKNEGR